MKHLLWLVLLFPIFSTAQNCDTIYLTKDNCYRRVDVEYRNCSYVNIDTVFTVFEKGGLRSKEEYCLTYIDPSDNKVLRKEWKANDTIHILCYYRSGKLKSIDKQKLSHDPPYFYSKQTMFYENGNVRKEHEYQTLTFSERKTYYPNGKIESRYKTFSYAISVGECIEYFQNGQISSVLNFSMPDSLFKDHQRTTLLSEKFFDESGNEVPIDFNRFYTSTEYLDEEQIYADTMMNGNYPSSIFKDQEAYANSMFLLKSEILKHLKLKKDCNCAKGVAVVSLVINSEGNINLKEVLYVDDYITTQIKKSIAKIKHWPPATFSNEAVGTYVDMDLILDF